MSTYKTVPWGPTHIRFLPRILDEKKVRAAALAVSPHFENMQDSFVYLGQDGSQMVAVVPTKPKAKAFIALTQGISLQEAMQQALEKAASFLKNRT